MFWCITRQMFDRPESRDVMMTSRGRRSEQGVSRSWDQQRHMLCCGGSAN